MRLNLKYLLVFLLLLLSPVLIFSTDILRILTWKGHIPESFIQKFEEKVEDIYSRPLTIKITYVQGSDDFYYSIRRKEVDIVLMSHQQFTDERYSYIENGLILPLHLYNIPNYYNLRPELLSAEYSMVDDIVYAMPISQGPYALIYNKDLVADAPTSWNDLWDEKYKGKYSIAANEYLYNINITALALGYSNDSFNDFNKLNNSEFRQKLRQLAFNANSLWVGVDSAEIQSGNYLGTSWGDSLVTLEEQGENWAMAEPIEGTPSWIDNYAITSALANKAYLKIIAEKFINEALSPEFQVDHILRKLSMIPTVTNIEDKITSEERDRLHFDDPQFFRINRILQKSYSQRDRNALKMLWDNATQGILHD